MEQCRFCSAEATHDYHVCQPHHKMLVENLTHFLVCRMCKHKMKISSEYLINHQDPACNTCQVSTRWALQPYKGDT